VQLDPTKVSLVAGSGTGIVWFRRDLRIRDHPALRAALDRHERIVPVFCFDDRLLHGRHESGPRTQFLLECLAELDSELGDLGSGLAVRHGKPEMELVEAGRDVDAEAIHFTREVGPFGRERGKLCRETFEAAGIEAVDHPGLFAVDELREIRTQQNKPYTVFSPFHRTWLDVERRDVLEAPREMPPLPTKLTKGRLPSLESLGLEQEVVEPARGGESVARKTLDRFLDGPVAEYKDNHDALGRDRTSPPRSASRAGAKARPASRSSTPGCASSSARDGCTTARGWLSARSSPRT